MKASDVKIGMTVYSSEVDFNASTFTVRKFTVIGKDSGGRWIIDSGDGWSRWVHAPTSRLFATEREAAADLINQIDTKGFELMEAIRGLRSQYIDKKGGAK